MNDELEKLARECANEYLHGDSTAEQWHVASERNAMIVERDALAAIIAKHFTRAAQPGPKQPRPA